MPRYHHTRNYIGLTSLLVGLAGLLQPIAYAQSDTDILDAARECQRIQELSARLACYDLALPPEAEALATPAPPPTPAPAPVPAARAEPVATAAEPMPAPAPESAPAAATQLPAAAPSPAARARPLAVPRSDAPVITARIVEVEEVTVTTTHFHAADGRVFIRARASRIYQWPEPPFDVEVQYNRFGTVYLKFESGLRVRVAEFD